RGARGGGSREGGARGTEVRVARVLECNCSKGTSARVAIGSRSAVFGGGTSARVVASRECGSKDTNVRVARVLECNCSKGTSARGAEGSRGGEDCRASTTAHDGETREGRQSKRMSGGRASRSGGAGWQGTPRRVRVPAQ